MNHRIKIKNYPNRIYLMLAFMCLSVPAVAGESLHELQTRWADVTYEVADGDRVDALTKLADRARQLSFQAPKDPEVLIWKGIIVSSLAGEKGGFGALGLAKEAKASLEEALEIDPGALQGSASTSLGTLYHQVPGWPIGFGSDKKARKLLQNALSVNPQGIDPNYFMALFLMDEGMHLEAQEHLLAAQAAPARKGRELADSGRQREIDVALAEVLQNLD